MSTLSETRILESSFLSKKTRIPDLFIQGSPGDSSFSSFSLVLIKLRAGNIRGYGPLVSDSKLSSPLNEPIPQASLNDNGTPHLQVVISSLIPQFYIKSVSRAINNNCTL